MCAARRGGRTLEPMTAERVASDVPLELPAPAPVEFLPTSVGEIAVRRTPVRGAGPHEPAVLVHGLGGNSLNWVDLAESLADRLECVSPHLPGFGATEPLARLEHHLASTPHRLLILGPFGQGRVDVQGGQSPGGGLKGACQGAGTCSSAARRAMVGSGSVANSSRCSSGAGSIPHSRA